MHQSSLIPPQIQVSQRESAVARGRVSRSIVLQPFDRVLQKLRINFRIFEEEPYIGQ
ncbi:MAG: hypothetical protein AAF657_03230 [Acidobacteriota bacterium]